MQEQLHIDVEILASPGTRKVGSLGHAKAIDYLTERMNDLGLAYYAGDSYKLKYHKNSQEYTNLAGVLPGLDRRLKPILLVAHYDTCGDQPGADDNAAAIAIWLSVIKAIQDSSLKHDVIFLFPDAEEPPRFLTDEMGSINFYQDQFQGEIHAGLVLDLVGHDVPLPAMEELLFIFGSESHASLADLLTRIEPPSGLRHIATLNRYVGDLSDHHILRKNGQPYLFFTCGRWEHYHQPTDKPENLNYAKMQRISIYLTSLILEVDGLEFGESGFGKDPVDAELYLIKRAIGPFLESRDIPMDTRDDIQKFVLNWVKQHGL